MNKPDRSHMEAYLDHLSTDDSAETTDKNKVEAQYLRSIYKVLPRKQGMNMSVKQARAKTVIKP